MALVKTTQKLNNLVRSIRHLHTTLTSLQSRITGHDDILHTLSTAVEDTKGSSRTIFKVYEQQRADLEQQSKRLRSLDILVTDLLHQVGSLEKPVSLSTSEQSSTVSSGDSKLQADDHVLDNFYVLFENHFRGSEADIHSRQKVYMPYFKESRLDSAKYPVLDIGCGRGEFIEVLKESNINAVGLDLNEAMIEILKEKKLKGVQLDALTYLKTQKTNSYMAITGFHIIEHIPFPELLRIFSECYRVLSPGGFVIFETPNPENTTVGSCNFYIDPSHLHPLPPLVTEFALATRGFTETAILRLHPIEKHIEHKDPAVKNLMEKFLGPQDYAVVAYKS